MIVYLARDIPAFVMYCVNGESGSSLLIELESTDSIIINPRRACARVTGLVLSVCLSACLSVCVFSLFWHLAQSGVQTAVSATSARYGYEI